LKLTWLATLVCSDGTGLLAMAGNGNVGPVAAGGYELRLANPIAQQAVELDQNTLQGRKFVQIEVTHVSNPRRIPLSFTVHFQPAQGEAIYLGSFSLFPPDNPGKFIVSTRGELKTGGTVTVNLVPLGDVSGEPEIRVQLKRLSFLPD
jgi:hypothetical protein